MKKFKKRFFEEINFDIRVFLYKSIIVFFLISIFFKVFFFDNINKFFNLIDRIDHKIIKIEKKMVNLENEEVIKNRFKNLLIKLIEKDRILDEEIILLIYELKNKIDKEIINIEIEKF